MARIPFESAFVSCVSSCSSARALRLPRPASRRMWRFLWSVLALSVLFSLGATGARANTLTVNTLADSADGTCGTTCSLRDALRYANAGDTVVFQSGLTGTINLTQGPLKTQVDLTIVGPGASLLTIDGSDATELLIIGDFSASNVSISGITFANGKSRFTGGVEADQDNSGTVSSLTVTNCIFVNNQATDINGGQGGAIGGHSSLNVNNSLFIGNSAAVWGGAISSSLNPNEGTFTVTNSTFIGNSAATESGGAIFTGADGSLVNNTFVGNSAPTGGAISFGLNGRTLTVSNGIVSRNTGGGIAGSGLNIIKVDHTVYYGNGDDCDKCNAQSGGGVNGNVDAGSDPLTLPLFYYGGPTKTFLPEPGSAAICAGSASDASNAHITTDQRGFPLSSSYCSNGGVDAGAVQSNYVMVNEISDQVHQTLCSNGEVCSFRDAMDWVLSEIGNGDIAVASGLVSPTSPGTITLTNPLPAIHGQMNIIGPGANQLTISGGNSPANGSVFVVGAGYSATLYGLTIANGRPTNSAGGGINNEGTLNILSSAVANNTVGNGFSGGGIFSNGPVNIQSSTISGNQANIGGGIASSAGELTIFDSTISGNSATGASSAGGGISSQGTAIILGSTVVGNTASTTTGGDTRGGGVYSANTLSLGNSIVAGNSAVCNGGFCAIGNADISGSYADFGGNEADNSASAASPINPKVSSLQYNGVGATLQTRIPLPGSPAICAGVAVDIPFGTTTDERGYPNTNTTYTGYSSAGPCIDSGAVQTNYTGVQWVQQPANGKAGQLMTPSPSVEVVETNTQSNTSDPVPGVPVTITPEGLVLASGTVTQPSAGAPGISVFSDLVPRDAGSGFSFTTDQITVVGSDTLAPVSSGSFDVSPMNPPVVTAAFTPDAISPGGNSALTITLTNPPTNPIALTGVGFDDTMPAGLSFGNGIVNTCGQIISASPTGVFLGGVTLAPGSHCSVTIPVSAAQAGGYVAAIVGLSENGGNSATASAGLQVGTVAPPTIAAAFSPAATSLGGPTTLTITISNPNVVPLTGVGFTDALPASLTTNGLLGNTCGQIVAASPTLVALEGVTLPAGSSCAVTVPVVSTTLYGVFQDSTSGATSNEGGIGNPGSAVLTVNSNGSVTVTGTSPASGLPVGGTAVTITGTNLNANAATVNFGSTPATNVIVVNAGKITAISPPGTGTVDVTVTTIAGTSSKNTTDKYAYVAPNYVVNTAADDPSVVATNCPAGGGAAACSLRDALAASSPTGGNITFSSTVFNSPQTIVASSGTLNIPSYTSIVGPTTGSGSTLQNLVTVSGGSVNNGYPVFTVASGVADTSIANLTISDGGSLFAGGIDNAGSLIVQNSTITGTDGNEAGAIYNHGGALNISNSTISGNISGHDGAGLYNAAGTATLTESTISGNWGKIGGGGILATGGTVNLNDSTVSGNYGGLFGPGILVTSAQVNVTNSIVSGNQEGSPDSPGNYDDVKDNTGDITFTTGNGGGNVIGYYNTNSANPPATAPNLAPLGNYGGPTQTMVPLPGSPAICAALSSKIPTGVTTDQRDFPVKNTTYTGYNAAHPCVDVGAVQTNYQSVQFTNVPGGGAYSSLSNTAVTPGPIVSVTENGQNLGGVPITLGFSGTGTASGLGPVNSVSGAGAEFDNVQVSLSGNDSLSVVLDINSSSTISLSSTAALDILASATSTTVGSSLNPSTYGQSVTFTSVVTPTTSGTGTPAGTINFSIDSGAANLGTPATCPGGSPANSLCATFTTASLSGGSHDISATYTPSNSFQGSSGDTSQSVNQAAQATLTVTGPSSITYGTTGTATSSGGSGTGALTFSAGTSTGCSVNGTTVTVTNAGGTCVLTATMAADTNYNSATSDPFSVTMIKADQATLTVTGPGNVTYGTTATATVSGGSGTGALTFSAGTSNGCSINGTTVSVNDASGSCSITATMTADNNHNAATSAPFGVTLIKANQATLKVTGPGSLVYGQTGTATATGGNGTGALTFTAGNSTGCAVNGTNVSVTNISAPCSITAFMAADNNYNQAMSAPFPVTLSKAASTLSGPATLTLTYGTGGNSSIAVAGQYSGAGISSPSGAVTYAIGNSSPQSVAILNGSAQITIPLSLAAGPYTVTISYAGDVNYQPATNLVIPLTINQAQATVTLGNLVQTYTGSPLAATASANPTVQAINIAYTQNGVPAIPINGGSYTVTATVNDPNYTGSATGTLFINRASESISFTAPPSPVILGNVGPIPLNASASSGLPVAFSVTGPATLSGNVLTVTGGGTVVVTASQNGNGNYLAATPISQTIVVQYDSAVTISSSGLQLSTYPGSANVTVCVTGTQHTAAAGSIQVLDNGVAIGTQPLGANGCASVAVQGLNVGTHVLRGHYLGNGTVAPGDSAPIILTITAAAPRMTLTCGPKSIAFGTDEQCQVSLQHAPGPWQNPAPPTGVVMLSLDGGTPIPEVLDGSGIASVSLPTPSIGSHTVIATYAGDQNYTSATNNDSFKVRAH